MYNRLRQAYNAFLSQEKETIYKDPGGRIRIVLAYPNTYQVGMSNLGFHSMYKIFNNRHDTLCERVFLPSRDLGREKVIFYPKREF